MQDNALVKIKITQSNGATSYGTAYCINANHLLTALHVLEGENNDADIELTFRGHNKPVTDYKVVYSSEKDWDIAVIELLDEQVIKALAKVSMAEPSSADGHTQWISAGFPKFAESEGERQREDIQGDAYNSDADAKSFHIECKKTVTKKQWGGISGAPVFDKANKKLVGVIKEVDTITENTHFFVSAIWRLIKQDDDFLKYFSQQNPTQKICLAAQQFLEKNKKLCEAFVGVASSEQDIVKRLSAYSLPDMLDKLEEIKDDLDNEAQQRELSKFSLLLLPYYFSHHAVLIDEALVSNAKTAISLECVGEVAAECCLASFNGRAAHIEKISGETEYDDDLRVVKNKFALAPEMGIGQTAPAIDPMESQILSSMALDNVLETRFAKGRINPQSKINLVLERAKKKGDSFYIVVRLGNASSTDYKNKRVEIQKYRVKYPNLIIINLSSNADLEEQEERDLIALPSIIEEI